MQRIEVIVPALTVSLKSIESKLLPLVNSSQASLQIIVHAYSPSNERQYFVGKSEMVNVRDEYDRSIDEWCTQFKQVLDSIPVDWDMTVSRNRDIGDFWKRKHEEDTSSLIIIFAGEAGSLHYYRSIIRSTSTPILIVFERNWHKPVNIVAAVDPFHQDDESSNQDVRIIKKSKAIAGALSAGLKVFHSCYVPPYVLNYRAKIIDIQRQNVRDFMDEHGFSAASLVMVNGEPSKTLREYISDSQMDVLCIGSTARGFLDLKHIGSTTEDILSDPPCDLLLIGSL